MDSSNPFNQSSGYLDLLNSQHFEPVSPSVGLQSSELPLFSSQWTNSPSQDEAMTEDRRGRRNWSQKEDMVLISAWLNISKDPIIGNEQKAGSFWKRIGAYFNESPQLVGMPDREVGNCKQRWSKISDQVSKFVASLRAATTQHSSGHNDNDTMKLAYEIYHHDNGARFTLEHCWRVLRYEQKWLSNFETESRTSKRRKGEDGSQASVQSSIHGDQVEVRPEGVKKAKERLKAERKAKAMEATSSKPVEKLQEMLEIRKQDHEMKKQEAEMKEKLNLQDLELKKQDFEMKEKLNKQAMLESLLAKKEPLSEIEVALRNKLISDMLS